MTLMQFSERLIFGLSLATLLFPVTISASIDFTGEANDQERSANLPCNLTFQPMIPYTNDNFMGRQSVAIRDFNNDNILDMAVANSINKSVSILFGDGNGTFLPEKIIFTGSNTAPQEVAVADFNNDNKLDLIITSYGSGTFTTLLGNGDGNFTVLQTKSTGCTSQPVGIAIAYFNKDNILDLAIGAYRHNRIFIYTGNGDGTFQSKNVLLTGDYTWPRGVIAGDLNHDNNTDIITAYWYSNTVAVFLGYGNGSFGSVMTFLVGTYPTWIAAADFNSDNNLDVTVVNMNDNTVSVLLGIGDGTFGTQTIYSVPDTYDSYYITIGDINNDGKQDILTSHSNINVIEILLGQGDGTFIPQSPFGNATLSWPGYLIVADFNRDNKADIVVSNYNSNTVGIFLGIC